MKRDLIFVVQTSGARSSRAHERAYVAQSTAFIQNGIRGGAHAYVAARCSAFQSAVSVTNEHEGDGVPR